MNNLATLYLKSGENLLINEKIEITKEEEQITFVHNNIKNTIDTLNKKFIREDAEQIFCLDIAALKCTFLLKKENYTLDILVEKATINQTINEVTINYFIETDDEAKTLKIIY